MLDILITGSVRQRGVTDYGECVPGDEDDIEIPRGIFSSPGLNFFDLRLSPELEGPTYEDFALVEVDL